MPTYYVDDGGNDSDGLSWATAYQSFASLVSAHSTALTTSGNVIYVGDTHNDPNKAAEYTMIGPGNGPPLIIVSCDQTDTNTPPAYKKGTGNQISSLGGAYAAIFDGSFAFKGIKIASGSYVRFYGDSSEPVEAYDCTFAPADGSYVSFLGNLGGVFRGEKIVVDLSADTGATANVVFQVGNYGFIEVHDLTFTIPTAYRTGTILAGSNGSTRLVLSGCDFSGFTNATLCEILATAAAPSNSTFSYCKTAETWGDAVSGAHYPSTRAVFNNVGNSYNGVMTRTVDYVGHATESTAVYRTNGASIAGVPCSWYVDATTSQCSEFSPFRTEWIYGSCATTGSKTFDVYIQNDTADFTNAEIWLELDFLETSGSPKWTRKTSRRVFPATAANVTDDSSDWSTDYTYKQKLSISATVGQTGNFRVRVGIGVASMAAARYCYIDPLVTVS